MDITIFDTVLSQPALKFTALRENEPASIDPKARANKLRAQ